MAFKFIRAGHKEPFIKVVMDGKDTWCSCSDAVRTYAKNNFAEGDDVEFEYEMKDGKPSITSKVTKAGGSSSSSKSSSSEKKETKSYSQPTGNKWNDPAVQESIKRQAVAHATTRALLSLQGHLNPNNIGEVFDTLYDKILNKVNG